MPPIGALPTSISNPAQTISPSRASIAQGTLLIRRASRSSGPIYQKRRSLPPKEPAVIFLHHLLRAFCYFLALIRQVCMVFSELTYVERLHSPSDAPCAL